VYKIFFFSPAFEPLILHASVSHSRLRLFLSHVPIEENVPKRTSSSRGRKSRQKLKITRGRRGEAHKRSSTEEQDGAGPRGISNSEDRYRERWKMRGMVYELIWIGLTDNFAITTDTSNSEKPTIDSMQQGAGGEDAGQSRTCFS
jgi:hypothetical protein